MVTNASTLVNFGATTQSVGDWMYSEYAMPSPGYLPLNSYTASYLVSSYPALGALIVPVLTPVTYAATARTLPSAQAWRTVAYGNGVFVALGYNSNAAATSTDGITWTARTMPSSQRWSDVKFANGIFVAVSGLDVTTPSTVAATSTDGITWTQRTMPSGGWTAVAYGNGIFVAVTGGGSGGSNIAASSPDGITWTSRTLPASANWTSAVYGNGVFVAMSTTSAAGVAVSTNGTTWTLGTISNNSWNGVAFGNGVFVAVAGASTVAASSVDGYNWTARTATGSGPLEDVAYGNNSFLAIGTGNFATSPDGVTWTSRANPTGVDIWTGLTFGANKFVGTDRASTANAFTVDYAVNATSFVLPVVAPKAGTTAYVKAT